MMLIPNVYAHSLYDPLPKNLFAIKWDFDPALVFFVVFALLYLRGLKKFRNRKPVANWQIGLFYLGILLIIVALLPPIDPLSDQLFFVHMIQHLIITSLGVPLMLFGIPFVIILRGMPRWVLKKIYRPMLKNFWVQLINKFFSHPLIALAVFEINYWLWHVPYLYNLALLNDFYHSLEHTGFALSALYLWRVIITPKPLSSPLPLPLRLLYLAVMMVLGVVLSAYLTFTGKVLYAYEGIPAPLWWTWDRITDQRLGGLIMWVPGEFLHFIAMAALFFTWAHQANKSSAKRLSYGT